MDSLNYYVFHFFDAGLRTLTSAIDNDDMNEESKENPHFDAEFARIRRQTLQININTDSFTRFGRNKNSKFTINMQFDEKNQDEYITDEDQDDADTFLDSLYQYVQTQGIDENVLLKLYEYLRDACYDTDATAFDLLEMGIIGNISRQMDDTDENIVDIAIRFFKSAKCGFFILFM